MGLGKIQEAPDLGFDRHNRRRDHATQAFGTGGKQDVPDEGVDRSTGDQADPVQVLVHGCHGGQVHADDESHRYVTQMFE